MNPTDPTTWHNMSQHPFFKGGAFDPKWYDGDVKEDLEKMRLLSLKIIEAFPNVTCELVVLDDCTMYVTCDRYKSTVAGIYPARTDEGEPCYFIDKPTGDELRVRTTKEVVDILRDEEERRDV